MLTPFPHHKQRLHSHEAVHHKLMIKSSARQYLCTFFSWLDSPRWARACSLSMFYDHTQPHRTQ